MLFNSGHKKEQLYLNKTLLSVCAGTVFISACMKDFASDYNTISKINTTSIPSPSPTQVAEVKAEEEKEVAPELILIGDTPFHYQAEIKWSKKLENVIVFSQGALAFKSSSKNVTNCFLGLDHNKEYKIQIFSHGSSDKSELKAAPTSTASPKQTMTPYKPTDNDSLVKEWVIQTPIDIDLSLLAPGFGFSFPWSLKAHRVFIQEEMPVVTNGYELKIDTDEFIILKNNQVIDESTFRTLSDGKTIEDAASISTFTKDGVNQRYSLINLGQPDNFWIHGKDGGLISIKTNKAVGKLNVFMRGQNGADGVNGVPFADTDRAPSGVDGFPSIYTDCTHFSGGVRNICNCSKESEDNENGHKGEKGKPGNNGSDGGRGGNSGILKFEMAELNPNFHIAILQEPGVSGTPGKAGPPQKGGLSGKVFTYKQRANLNPFSSLVCKEAIDEGEGKEGDPGIDGIKQSNGIIEQNCISKGEGFGRCAN